jgi:hypothetical protein
MNKIARPISRDLAFLNQWMQRTDLGNVYLHGEDRATWSNEEWKPDLISLGARRADDVFFQWVYDTLTRWYHQILGRHIKVCSF